MLHTTEDLLALIPSVVLATQRIIPLYAKPRLINIIIENSCPSDSTQCTFEGQSLAFFVRHGSQVLPQTLQLHM